MGRCKKTGLAIVVAALLAWPAAAVAYGPNPPASAEAACDNAVTKQSVKGVMAGGGPKAGSPAPLNCDHYYQTHGYIGNGTPGP